MARFSGKAGSITNAGTNIALTSWEIDAKGAADDVTGMDDAGVKEFLAGLTEWSGSFEGFATGDVSASAPGASFTAAVFKSSATAGAPKLTGNAISTGLKVTSAVDGAVKASCTFQGSGTLTWGVTP
jgi:hypothetical protein